MFAALPATAEQQEYTNTDVVTMIRAGVPESTMLNEIEHVAQMGQAKFDISPRAIIDLRRQGASEEVLNAIIWVETEVAAVLRRPEVRAIVYRSANRETQLSAFVLWPPVAPHWEVWPFFLQTGYRIPLRPAMRPVRIAQSNPSLLVQGFSPDANWELVRVRAHNGGNDLRLKKKGVWGSDFFRDDVFRADDLQPLRLADAGGGSFSITPATALAAGHYVLCGEAMERAIMRFCYPFEIAAGGI
jgi:hypothetical protein